MATGKPLIHIEHDLDHAENQPQHVEPVVSDEEPMVGPARCLRERITLMLEVIIVLYLPLTTRDSVMKQRALQAGKEALVFCDKLVLLETTEPSKRQAKRQIEDVLDEEESNGSSSVDALRKVAVAGTFATNHPQHTRRPTYRLAIAHDFLVEPVEYQDEEAVGTSVDPFPGLSDAIGRLCETSGNWQAKDHAAKMLRFAREGDAAQVGTIAALRQSVESLTRQIGLLNTQLAEKKARE